MSETNDTKRPTGPVKVESPIINSPFYEPRYHWQIQRGQSVAHAGSIQMVQVVARCAVTT